MAPPRLLATVLLTCAVAAAQERRELLARVLTSGGRPLAGATARYVPWSRFALPVLARQVPGEPEVRGSTTADGTLRLLVPAGAGTLLIEHESGLGALVPRVVPGTPLRVGVEPCGEIVWQTGAAVPRTWIRAVVAGPQQIPLGERSGRRLRLPPGEYALLASSGGRALDQLTRVLSGQEARLELDHGLFAKVRIPSAVEVRLAEWPEFPLLPDADGRLTLPLGQGARIVQLLRRSEGLLHTSEHWLSTSSEPDRALTMPTATTDTVTVCDLAGAPVAAATVLTLEVRGQAVTVRASAGTDRDGRARYAQVDTNVPTTLLALGADGAIGVLVVPIGAVAPRLSLPGSRRLEVAVRDQIGAPLPGFAVAIHPQEWPWLRRRAFADAHGKAVFTDVGPGTQVVTVAEPGFVAEAVLLAAAADGSSRTTLVADAGRPIVGKVFDATARPVAGALVVLRDTSGRWGFGERSTTTDAQGGFVFLGLPDDLFTLFATREVGSSTWSAKVRGVQPGDTEWRLDLKSEDVPPPGGKQP